MVGVLHSDVVLDINIRPEIAFFGSVLVRDGVKHFGILEEDRRRHMYVLGKTGMGKSHLLSNLILQDINNGHGCAFLDAHGDTLDYILQRIPEHRLQDVVYFNPADTDFPFGFNIFEQVSGEQVFLLASGMMSVFKRIWEGAWSARMEYILNNTLLALLETPGNTLLDVVRMLQDDVFRARVVREVQDPVVKNFWVKEFASFNDKYRTEAIAPILNKIGQFFSTSLIRNILGQQKSTFNLREVMDSRKILLINLSKGKLGDDNASLIGSLMITKLQLAAMSRVDIPEEERADFYVYVDEFQNFITDSFATILSEARKYRLLLILAHQYIDQLVEASNHKIKHAVFGNVGTIIAFRVGAQDAQFLQNEFAPSFSASDLVRLNKYQMALKMPINSKVTPPFLASSISPLYSTSLESLGSVVSFSRKKYARAASLVDVEIRARMEPDVEDLSFMNKKARRKHRASTQFGYNAPLQPAIHSLSHTKLEQLKKRHLENT